MRFRTLSQGSQTLATVSAISIASETSSHNLVTGCGGEGYAFVIKRDTTRPPQPGRYNTTAQAKTTWFPYRLESIPMWTCVLGLSIKKSWITSNAMLLSHERRGAACLCKNQRGPCGPCTQASLRPNCLAFVLFNLRKCWCAFALLECFPLANLCFVPVVFVSTSVWKPNCRNNSHSICVKPWLRSNSPATVSLGRLYGTSTGDIW
mmetsp:Transcript_12439/g.31408  ORF Transcript_12439/g.31408 Transcript_12439/m.31408 type:complete len:206 (-) Transcript_12439:645-1262(-)